MRVRVMVRLLSRRAPCLARPRSLAEYRRLAKKRALAINTAGASAESKVVPGNRWRGHPSHREHA